MSNDIQNLCLPQEDMKALLTHTVSEDDAKKYQELYEAQLDSETVDLQVKFQYGWCLVHSRNTANIKKGACIFEEVFKEGSEEIKRDSLFYLALAEAKLKNYCTASKYIKAFLSVEPSNIQAQQLDVYIQKQLKKDGLTGMALFGAATLFGGVTAIVVGTLAVGAALGFAIVSKKR